MDDYTAPYTQNTAKYSRKPSFKSRVCLVCFQSLESCRSLDTEGNEFTDTPGNPRRDDLSHPANGTASMEITNE